MFTRIIVITLLLATACTANPVQNSPEPQNMPVATEKNPFGATATPSTAIQDDLQKKVTQMAMDDLAARLTQDVELISIISTESAVWPSAALGCPLPDKVYAQGRVHGFRIRLEANGQVYDYHTDRTGQVILCLEPEVKPDEPGLR